jgi:S-adenosyl methyltransferase
LESAVSAQPSPWQPSVPTGDIARLRDAILGGVHANEAERKLAEDLRRRFPALPERAAETRRFHSRAAEWAVLSGARGAVFGAAGYPVRPYRHEAAMAANPDARFAYADPDPWVRLVLRDALESPRVRVCPGTPREPGRLLARPEVAAIGEPLQMHAPMAPHYWLPNFAAWLIGEYGRLLTPGSSLTVSMGVMNAEFAGAMTEAAGTQVYRHSPADLARWLHDAGLVPVRDGDGPGVMDARAWPRSWAETRFARSTAAVRIAVAVAVKPLGARDQAQRALPLLPPGRLVHLSGEERRGDGLPGDALRLVLGAVLPQRGRDLREPDVITSPGACLDRVGVQLRGPFRAHGKVAQQYRQVRHNRLVPPPSRHREGVPGLIGMAGGSGKSAAPV